MLVKAPRAVPLAGNGRKGTGAYGRGSYTWRTPEAAVSVVGQERAERAQIQVQILGGKPENGL